MYIYKFSVIFVFTPFHYASCNLFPLDPLFKMEGLYGFLTSSMPYKRLRCNSTDSINTSSTMQTTEDDNFQQTGEDVCSQEPTPNNVMEKDAAVGDRSTEYSEGSNAVAKKGRSKRTMGYYSYSRETIKKCHNKIICAKYNLYMETLDLYAFNIVLSSSLNWICALCAKSFHTWTKFSQHLKAHPRSAFASTIVPKEFAHQFEQFKYKAKESLEEKPHVSILESLKADNNYSQSTLANDTYRTYYFIFYSHTLPHVIKQFYIQVYP